ncbi:MAG: hypothetical protein DCF19_00485 [Pseudanabaena frigida]|uniref:DUF2808 domain-containing protein n=1 Tax=Pseudanabaena frigida TaxID=945775 RepID=A0A2W4WP86_9CYAN|nr:MAG: hypothetical protein DCF19_00485 [Pseudanabaena frigida]
MRQKTIFVISFCVMSSLCSITLADVPVANEGQKQGFGKLIFSADIVHLDGAVTVTRTEDYQVKWNSVRFLPVEKRKDTYSERRLVGGTNNSNKKKNVVALIPIYAFRGIKNPAFEIAWVNVNGKAARCFLLLPESDINKSIEIAQQAFGNNKLFSTQLDPRVPTLFIDAGTVQPNADIRIEYEIKPRSRIVFN